MNNLKEAILERLINSGKKNKRLKTPVFMLIALFLVLFHGIRNFCMQFKLHSFNRRVLAITLCVCLVISSMPATDYVLPVLAAENSEEEPENVQEEIQENIHDDIYEIVSFTELPDEVREQTVAVGTPLESLVLPDTLTASCRITKEKNPEDDKDSDKEQELEEEDKQPDEGDEENPEEGSEAGNEGEPGDSDNGGEENGDESGGSGNEGEGSGDESGDSENEGEGNEEESGDSDNEGEGSGDESGNSGNVGEGAGNESGESDSKGEGKGDGSGDSDNKGEEKEEAVEKQETFTVTLPENYAMPDDLPEIKELIYEETVTIDGITWESLPEYDGEMEGVYLFTPVISDATYTLAEDVELPEISVTVAEAEIMLAEEELPDVSESTTPMCGVISKDATWGKGTLSNGELIIKPGVTLTINGEVTLNGTVTIKGEGTIQRGSGSAYIRIESSADVTVSNIIIDGGAPISSSNSIIYTSGNLTICDRCIIRNCKSSGDGGAIKNNGGGLTIRDITISKCSAKYGGAIDNRVGVGGVGVLTMENASIIDCSANDRGGAIYNSGSSVILDNITIENCLANDYGGAIFMTGLNSSGAHYEPDVTIKDGEFINNKTISDGLLFGGGCIWAGYGTLNIYGGNFTGNTSVGRGGCIYQYSSVINISGGYFEGNTCTNSGYEGSGAVYTDPIGGQLILSSDAHFCGDDAFGTDGIMLDGSRKVLISDTLNYPATVYVAASDGRVIAEGTDGYILSLEKDIEKIKFVDIGNSGAEYRKVLDEENNQIKLIRIDPDDIEYTVEHYLQDVSGDGYTMAEADTETLTGTAGEVVHATPKPHPGFTENTTHGSRVESGVVASDDSLVLKLYYDRDVYNIAFDLNGGAGTAPEAQTLRYGAPLQEPGRPDKRGYSFLGWYKDEQGTEGEAWDFAKPVEENTEKKSETLYAKWVDDIAPRLMQAEFNEGYTSLSDWLIRKKDLIITAPIIEEGSGVKQADYVLASLEKSDNEKESAQAQIIEEDGRTVAKITISYDFRGTVSMTCTDNAENISAGKTLTSPGGGAAFIVEDNAPEITFSSKDGNLSDTFDDNVTVNVAVNDEETQGNADTVESAKISGGIASVTYCLDDGTETAVEGKGFESGIVPSCSFSVEISGAGEHILRVMATDNAGNANTDQVRIKIAKKPTTGKTKTPVIPVSRKKSPEPNSSAPVTEQVIALADAPQPLKTADPVRDNEPRTGDISHVEVYATIAMVTGLLYVLLYFTTDKNGMTQEEKEQFLSSLISWAKRGGKPRRLLATAIIFLFLVYYHSIGKCVEFDEKEVRIWVRRKRGYL